jgi:hypothetical protein
MNEPRDDLNYRELKAELQILQGRMNELNDRLNGITSAPSSAPKRRFAKLPAFRWQLAIGFVVLAAAVAQTSDPITIGPDGRVRMGKSLDVAETVKAKSFVGDGAGLTVNGDSITQTVAGKFKSAIDAGNSDIYFTKTNHDHSSLGNTQGNAALENASNYNSLMVLGRATTNGRVVRMWDRVGIGGNGASTVATPLDVKGEIRGLPWRSADFAWNQNSKTPTKMTRTDRSVCFLTAVTGYFLGGGEQVQIVASNNYWYLQGKSQTKDVGAVARCIGAPDDSW